LELKLEVELKKTKELGDQTIKQLKKSYEDKILILKKEI